ncbi:MAG: hypothetical protein PVJ39_03720 [Gammaproteobacteria bacterium]
MKTLQKQTHTAGGGIKFVCWWKIGRGLKDPGCFVVKLEVLREYSLMINERKVFRLLLMVLQNAITSNFNRVYLAKTTKGVITPASTIRPRLIAVDNRYGRLLLLLRWLLLQSGASQREAVVSIV